MSNLKRRLAEEKLFKLLMQFSAGMIVFALVLLIGSVLFRGLPALSWSMITETPKGGYYMGKEGGIANAIIGSLYLAFGATLVAGILALPVAFYLNAYRRKNSRFSTFVRLCFDVMWGIPSIVYGAFGFTIMVALGMKTSLLAGIIVVAVIILPVIVRTADEVMMMIPSFLPEASYALGATRFQTAIRVIFRQCLPGICTALLVAFGRAIGDAAAVLFTAGYSDYIPTSLSQSTATLPLAIFFQLGTPFPEVQDRAYAAALILTVLILIVSILARILTGVFKKYRV
jgi:phosphate transport system permease protein